MSYRWFSERETKGLVPKFAAKLDKARGEAGVPFIITSGKRTQAANTALHGSISNSAHLVGLAVDLACFGNDHTLNRIIYGLVRAGLGSRIGLYYAIEGTYLVPKHIHVDDDTSKPPEVTWGSLERNG